MEKNTELSLNGNDNVNIRKLYECQFALQGTEKEVENIIKIICKISEFEEVQSFSMNEK